MKAELSIAIADNQTRTQTRGRIANNSSADHTAWAGFRGVETSHGELCRNVIRVTRYAEDLFARGDALFLPFRTSPVSPFFFRPRSNFRGRKIEVNGKSEVERRSERARQREGERERERRVDGFYPDGISSLWLGVESVSIGRRVSRMEINRRRRLATLSHLCKSGHRLIDKIFKSSEAPKVHSNDNHYASLSR